MAKHDSSRLSLLLLLSATYRFVNGDSTVYYSREAYKLSQELKSVEAELLSLGSLGVALLYQGDFPGALQAGFQALQISDDNDQKTGLQVALNALGLTYLAIGDYEKALNYLKQMADLAATDPVSVGYAWSGIGVVFMEMNQTDSAHYYQRKAVESFEQVGLVEPLTFQRLGDVEMRKRNPARAMEFYRQSLRMSALVNERRAKAQTLLQMANLKDNNGQLDSAIYYATEGLSIAESLHQKRTILGAATLLAHLYESQNDSLAVHYYKMAATIKESMLGAGNMQAIRAMVQQEEQRRQEVATARSEYQNRLRMNALLGSTFTLAVIAFALVRNNRLKQKAKQKIEQAYDQLKTTQTQLIHSEKMASLGELTAGIAHEIQNPLNFVNNFSEVNTELIDELNDEAKKGNLDEVKAIARSIKDNEQKINHHGKRADTIVKGMLQHSRMSSGQKELTDINALCHEYLRLSYHGLRAKDKLFNAKFETDFDSSLPKLNVVPQDIGRVILNLVNNAFYAVTLRLRQRDNTYKPTVTVSTRKEGNSVLISVKDNGNGIPESIKEKIFQPFFTTKPTGQGTGLGLSLSYDIVKGHCGTIDVENKQEGTEFSVKLPVV